MGGLHLRLHCVRGSYCAICVIAGEMTTLLACRVTCLLGTSVIDAHPTETGKTLTDSNNRTSELATFFYVAGFQKRNPLESLIPNYSVT